MTLRAGIAAILLLLSSAHTAANETEAKALQAELPMLEQAATGGDYAAAVTLSRVYLQGVFYQVETIGSRLTPRFSLGSPGLGPSYRPVVLIEPQPAALQRVLGALAAQGDPWAQYQLARFHARPQADELAPALKSPGGPAWPASSMAKAFPADPALLMRLLAGAAAPAEAIVRGPATAVFAASAATPVAQQASVLAVQHRAVADALLLLAEAHERDAATQDLPRALANYQQLAALLSSSNYAGRDDGSIDFAKRVREVALLRAEALRTRGGTGLAPDCPAAVRELIARAEAFPDASTRALGRLERERLYGQLQSTIGMIFYNGCAGVPADRAQAFAWLARDNAGAQVQSTRDDTSPMRRGDNKFRLSPPAMLALADLLDRGSPGNPPDPRTAFDTYWVAAPSGAGFLRIAQMIEVGDPYTSIEKQRATLFYCRAAREFGEPTARDWLVAHPAAVRDYLGPDPHPGNPCRP